MMGVTEILESISANGIRWVKLQFTDIYGKLREVTVDSSQITSTSLKKGIEVELSGVFSEGKEKVRLIPFLESYAIIPWEEFGARLLCYVEKNGKIHEKDPYGVYKKVEERYEALGYEIYVEYSQEYSSFETVSIDKVAPQRGPSVTLDTREGIWNVNPFSYHENWNNLSSPDDVYSLVRVQVVDALKQFFNIIAKRSYHGDASAKQVIELPMMKGEDGISSLLSLRYLVKNISILNGVVSSFIPYAIYSQKPNMLKIRITLRKSTGTEVFKDVRDKYGLSKAAYSFIAGVLKYYPAISPFLYPTTNSYKGLVTANIVNAFSPVLENTTVYAKDGVVEIKACSSSNPWTATSSILIAGLNGMKKKLPAPSPLLSSVDELSQKEKKSIVFEELPLNLYEALTALEKEAEIFKGFVSPEYMSDYLSQKLKEYKEELSYPTLYEYMKYFNV